MHMKYIVISFLVLAISVSILVLLGLVTSYFMIICKKMCSFPGESSMQIWSKIPPKKADLYANWQHRIIIKLYIFIAANFSEWV